MTSDKTIPQLRKVKYNDEFQYLLMDDGGCCDMYLPIVLAIGSLFSHELGTYKVWKHHETTIDGVDVFCICCDRVEAK